VKECPVVELPCDTDGGTRGTTAPQLPRSAPLTERYPSPVASGECRGQICPPC